MIAALLLAALLQSGRHGPRARIDSIPGVDDSVDRGPAAGRASGPARAWRRSGCARRRDTVGSTPRFPTATVDWSDDFVISLRRAGERAAAPGHEEFQWYFRRVLDSSVVYRGRDGRWEAPRETLIGDWGRSARAVAGTSTPLASSPGGWWLRLRLDPAWLDGQDGALARDRLRVHDDGSKGGTPGRSPGPAPSAGASSGRPRRGCRSPCASIRAPGAARRSLSSCAWSAVKVEAGRFPRVELPDVILDHQLQPEPRPRPCPRRAPTLYAKSVAWVEAGPTRTSCRIAPRRPGRTARIGRSPPQRHVQPEAGVVHQGRALADGDSADERSADLEPRLGIGDVADQGDPGTARAAASAP